MRNIQFTLKEAEHQLTKITATPALDAELLLASVLQCSRTILHTWPEREMSDDDYQTFLAICAKRLAGIPVAYLLEQQSFWKFDLRVTPDVLIPRPETELLVELVLETFADIEPLSLIDLGTGSGAIALALAYEFPTWKISATDNSPAALAIAQENAQRLEISSVQWIASDWYANLNEQKFNAIVSNPPYIAPGDHHLPALQYEPQSALVAEQEGLAALQEIITHAPEHLLENGYLFLEHGYQQAEAVQELMGKAGFKDIQTYVDLAGQPRVTSGVYIV
jgi:release factor glutamine methyltransferase